MSTEKSNVRVCQATIEETVERLDTYVRRMERRYECTSDFVTSAVGQGYLKETAEISRWLTSYRTLRRLQADGGPETGTTIVTTR